MIQSFKEIEAVTFIVAASFSVSVYIYIYLLLNL